MANDMETKTNATPPGMPTIPESVKSAVNAYLMARAYAEVHREKVDSIQRHLLETAKYYVDPKWKDTRSFQDGIDDERITDLKLTYLMSDSESKDYFADLKAALIKAGYEIEDIPGAEGRWKCPALVAESLQRDTERLIIECASDMVNGGENFADKLLCFGLERYHRFIDLVVGMVVSMPGFKNPLTGEVA